MPDRLEPAFVRDFVHVHADALQTNGTVQRKDGGWRLRWRATDRCGRTVHRSRALTDDAIPLVEAELRRLQAQHKATQEQVQLEREHERDARRGLRRLRQAFGKMLPGGRPYRRQMLREFDHAYAAGYLEIFLQCQPWLEPPPKLGRPYGRVRSGLA